MAIDVDAKPAEKAKAGVTLTTLVEWFEESEELTREAREDSELDRDYYDGKQWTKAEQDVLNERKQPPLVFNRIKGKANFVTGNANENRTDPKAFPRRQSSQENAQRATDAIRFVVDNINFDEKALDVLEYMNIEGYGFLEFGVQRHRKSGQLEIFAKRWKWDRCFFDPYSSEHDFSDARYTGGVMWMDMSRAMDKWPDKKKMFEATMLQAPEAGETYDDKPRHNIWATKSGDGKRSRVRIAQIYYEAKGEWWWAIYTKGGLIKTGRVEHVDDEGLSYNPMIGQSAYVDRENNRYGDTRVLRDPQSELNKRRSYLLHQGVARQTMGTKGAVDSVDAAKKELSRADGHVEKNPGENHVFDIIPQNDQIQVQAKLLEHAEAELQLSGPNASLLGKGSRGASGKAIVANQQGGLVELSQFMRRYRDFKLRCYRTIWFLIQQYWTDERYIRIVDDEKNIKFSGFNTQGLGEQGQQMLQQAQASGEPDDQLEKLAGEIAQQMPEMLETQNRPSEIDVDIIIDEVPNNITIQAEQFELMVKLAQSGIQLPPEALIEMSSLRNKKQILAKLQNSVDPEQAELAKQAAVADIDLDKAGAMERRARAVKATVEAQQIAETPPDTGNN